MTLAPGSRSSVAGDTNPHMLAAFMSRLDALSFQR